MNRSLSCNDPTAQRLVLNALRNELPLEADRWLLAQIRVVSDGWFDQRHECSAVIESGSQDFGGAPIPVSYETMVAINGRDVVIARARGP